MLFAIVDIETTGGHASASGITEIAIVIHNGTTVEGRYSTLINPLQPIPHYITALTGITKEMVETAPSFDDVAENIYNLLEGKIFVAHNVNFDFSFIKHHLKNSGYELSAKKLCTVRLARKILPGYASYSLGNICRELNIPINGRHRALGDAEATVILFEKLLKEDSAGHINIMLKGRNKEQYLPIHLPAKHIDALPAAPGVYYFHDAKGKIIYVGKATHLQRRVKSHFSNNDSGKRKQELNRRIYSISHKICSSELMALVLESIEIRKWWPEFNRSQKKYHPSFGLYLYEDGRGYLRLVVEKKKTHIKALYTCNTLFEGQNLLRKMVIEFDLDERLLFGKLVDYNEIGELPEIHNRKIATAVDQLQQRLPSFIVVDGEDEYATCLLMERGRFYGTGKLPSLNNITTLEEVKPFIEPLPDNDFIRGLLYAYAEKFPERKIPLSVTIQATG